ncbi:Protein of unknown function [Gryllus bimaculatus]|nr:Protein of unknown function [Gryllus bimaculatus]
MEVVFCCRKRFQDCGETERESCSTGSGPVQPPPLDNWRLRSDMHFTPQARIGRDDEGKETSRSRRSDFCLSYRISSFR